MRYLQFYLLMLFITGLVSCKNETEAFVTDSITDFFPVQVGKYITYRIDSTVFTKSGSQTEVHKYQVKHTIESETVDSEGRKTFVVHRLISNETGTSPWLENGNYFVTPLADRIEVIENNLRIIKLFAPFKTGFSWKGNAYLASAPYKTLFDMRSAGIDMNQWNFVYSNFGDTAVNGQQYQNVWTVSQNNYVLNIPAQSAGSIGIKEIAQEKYAKNIGLVYKDFQLYERQPPNADNPQQTFIGFGITMWMVGHN